MIAVSEGVSSYAVPILTELEFLSTCATVNCHEVIASVYRPLHSAATFYDEINDCRNKVVSIYTCAPILFIGDLNSPGI